MGGAQGRRGDAAADKVSVALPVAAIALALACRGGYYPSDSAWLGLLLCLLTAVQLLRGRRIGLSFSWLCPLLTAAACLASACFAGLSYSNVLECAPWLSAAVFAALCGSAGEGCRGRAPLAALAWLGVACGALGMLVFSGVVPLEGALNAGRLQFTLQYANSAALTFLVFFLVGLFYLPQRFRLAAALPLCSLLLSQSASTLLLALVCGIAVVAWSFKVRWHRFALDALICALFAAVAAGASFAWDSLALPGLLALAGLAALRARGRLLVPAAWEVRAAVLACAACLLAGLCLLALLWGRLGQATGTLLERGVQVADAWGLFTSAPLLGIGPDAWATTYPFVQSAQYTASVVHCSYMQVALDSGLAGLLPLLAYGAFVVRGRARVRRRAGWTEGLVCAVLCVAAVGVHAALDFDLQFVSVLFLLAFLVHAFGLDGRPVEASGRDAGTSRGRTALSAFACAAAACFFAAFLGLQVVSTQEKAALLQGDAEAADRFRDEGSLAARDPNCRLVWCGYLRAHASGDEIRAYAQSRSLSMDEASFLAQGLYAAGESQQAEEVLLNVLREQPYNVSAFEHVAAVFEDQGASEEALASYEECRKRSNALAAQGAAALLPSQEAMPECGSGS